MKATKENFISFRSMKLAVLTLICLCTAACTSNDVQTFSVNGVSFNMIRVEGGTFLMGATREEDSSNSEFHIYEVTLNDYYIGETEVSQELWVAVMGKNPSLRECENQPVENVSWDDCLVFIERLNSITGQNFRLPMETEWEYAARGGNKSNGYIYSGSNNIDEVAWYYDNSDETHQAVKSKRPNELGIYDMSGNVNEWCQDEYKNTNKYFDTPSTTVPAGASYRVCRGGSWTNETRDCLVTERYGCLSNCGDVLTGVRLVL